ncbi:sirohydrochlorin ferrochelatase [Haloactinospora alba]|uniref:Sirohydrochlorin ferrochelatase n=1 Tax=Haloactinospora alba TaxID=405555 RepID=A0A543NLJ2_9ACTN|nr:cobalamin biosynthesis protein CbiX [Haloactinospora alba]TQN32715.1 sirohydrochlorin ferrochelatase [Haloactinospora alba]
MVPTMVLVADDERDTHRQKALRELATAVADRNEAPVVGAFGSPAEVNETIRAVDGPLVLVPAFLAGGDRASAELLAQLDLNDRGEAYTLPPLGAVPSIIAELARRLQDHGWAHGDGVVLAADGCTGQEDRRVVTDVSRMLSRRLQAAVHVGYLNVWAPSVWHAAQRLRNNGHPRVTVANWCLVGGSRERDPNDLAASGMTDPLWPSPLIVDLLLARHRAGKARLAA